jgi:type IV pilus assembly protein PilE
MRSLARQRGYSLVELMVTIAILGVIVKLALPLFLGESRKSKAGTEVEAVFTELALREERYFNEAGLYLGAAACPAAPSLAGQSAQTCVAAGQPWYNLRVILPMQTVYCSYAITVGTTTGTVNPSGFSFSSPNYPWFYLLATCDMDGSPSVNSTYFMSSLDPKIQKLNEGM